MKLRAVILAAAIALTGCAANAQQDFWGDPERDRETFEYTLSERLDGDERWRSGPTTDENGVALAESRCTRQPEAWGETAEIKVTNQTSGKVTTINCEELRN